ncbi:hypothetical protein QE364_002852 [Nocardioides zeae]|uniref:DUF4259 domain-containing protein n=2 Tax=Nocardioides zeae TaxID=1457234 RepID=A0AAJ1U7P0_9ACTN|nr:DUF4259 domain-containing protein [Nocardioides zeae]MDQ1104907.1 hypothetical protein [Nocardioides zeae]MDR6175378.1 hypothetical protein [Nocardioides zeae]MDR6211131.1 hypothetical protein [Nocardioides zeae]
MGTWDEGLFGSDAAADVAMDAAGAPPPMVEGFLREAMARWDDEEDAADPAAAVALVLYAVDPTGIEQHPYVSGWPRRDWVPSERLVGDARVLGERLLAEADEDDEDAGFLPRARAELRALLDRTRGVPVPQAPLAPAAPAAPPGSRRRRWPFGRSR